MSLPPNALAAYRSYSYYHVLVMCDCTNTADIISSSPSQDVWLHATPSTMYVDSKRSENLGRYTPKAAKDSNGKMVGKYCVLINGSTDAAYSITKASWIASSGAGAAPNDANSSLALEGSLTISEPKGISFLDQVVNCCIALGVDSSQVVFLLKTFFVGHKSEVSGSGSSLSDQITDIPPLNFIAVDVSGSFDQTGGNYNMVFVSPGHGATRLPQYSRAVNTISLAGDKSLQSTLTRLQDSINVNYEKYFQCVVDQFKGLPNAQPMIDSLRKVKYEITVSDYYADKGGVIKYTVTDQPEHYKNAAGCDKPVQLSFPSGMSIESAIRQIMSMSNEVQNDSAKGDANGIKSEYKIHTGLLSTPISGSDSNNISYTVFYKVERFINPKSIAKMSSFGVLQTNKSEEELKKDPEYDTIRRNIIEFDYIYTGKNIDILEFDMKVNMGLSYLQTATLANTFKTPFESAPNRAMSVAPSDISRNSQFGSKELMQIPVFFGTQIKAPSNANAQDAGISIQSTYNLAKHASIELAESKMKIVGNCALLGTTNVASSPEGIVRNLTSSTDQPFQSSNTPTTTANFADWSRVPSIAKVRIKMPANNDDMALFGGNVLDGANIDQTGFADYARDFWFDGYYYVFTIEHIFDNGEFTQVLDMLALPKVSAYESSKSKGTPTTNTSVPSCFDSIIGCAEKNTPKTATVGNVTASVPSVPPPKHPEDQTNEKTKGADAVTNKKDADTVLKSKYELSNVVGWNKADPAVQRAIVNAAAQAGIDPVVLAMVAAQESRFDPQSVNKDSSKPSYATGLFQFVTGTWDGLVKQGKATGKATPSGVLPAPNDPRFDPVANANAGAIFLRDNAKSLGSSDPGDLYLSHLMGEPRAKLIIAADRATSGSQLVKNLLTTKAFAAVKSQNPTIINDETTVGRLRGWAASTMATKVGQKTATPSKALNDTTPKSAPVSTPVDRPKSDTRTGGDAVGAQVDCTTQASKVAEKTPCGPRAKPDKQDSASVKTQQATETNSTTVQDNDNLFTGGP